MNAARKRLEAAKQRNAERHSKERNEVKSNLNEKFVGGFVVLRQPTDGMPCSFLIPKDKIHTTVNDICKNGLWMRRQSGVLNFVPPDNIAVIEIEELENT